MGIDYSVAPTNYSSSYDPSLDPSLSAPTYDPNAANAYDLNTDPSNTLPAPPIYTGQDASSDPLMPFGDPSASNPLPAFSAAPASAQVNPAFQQIMAGLSPSSQRNVGHALGMDMPTPPTSNQ